MTRRLFRSKSWGGVPRASDDKEEYCYCNNRITTPFISPDHRRRESGNLTVLALLLAALRKSLVTSCAVVGDVSSDDASLEIGYPTDIHHLSHVTFDPFNGFLGLPLHLQPHLPPKPPSASISVFGVSAESMICSYDERGNSVPTILLMMQKRLYSGGGLQAEGIFRINGENNQEEDVRKQLNRGFVPYGIDVHCLAGLIKAWFRELPRGVLDSLTPEQVMQCNTEEQCSHLVESLPPTEAALLDWAINLMADVVNYQQLNKMNARNIAMVFAPNMTQMADPLTALIHAVQVMNLLKTLVIKNVCARDEAISSSSPKSGHGLEISEKNDVYLSFSRKSESMVDISPPTTVICVNSNNTDGSNSLDQEREERVYLRKGGRGGVIRRLCKHPVFQLTTTKPKKTNTTSSSGSRNKSIHVGTRRGYESWA